MLQSDQKVQIMLAVLLAMKIVLVMTDYPNKYASIHQKPRPVMSRNYLIHCVTLFEFRTIACL